MAFAGNGIRERWAYTMFDVQRCVATLCSTPCRRDVEYGAKCKLCGAHSIIFSCNSQFWGGTRTLLAIVGAWNAGSGMVVIITFIYVTIYTMYILYIILLCMYDSSGLACVAWPHCRERKKTDRFGLCVDTFVFGIDFQDATSEHSNVFQ